MLYEGERIIRIISNRSAWKYGSWYEDLVEKEFTALAFSITEAEYTVEYNGEFYRLPMKDVEIVSDNSKPFQP